MPRSSKESPAQGPAPLFSPTTEGHRYPVVVWVLWHLTPTLPVEEDAPALTFATALHHHLGGEWRAGQRISAGKEPSRERFGGGARVEAEIPVLFLPMKAPDAEIFRSAVAAHPAERCFVVLVLDDHTTTHQALWAPLIRELYAQAESSKTLRVHFVPSPPNSATPFPDTRDKGRADADGPPAESLEIYTELLGSLCRLLTGEAQQKVMLSYAQEELGSAIDPLKAALVRGGYIELWIDKERVGQEDIRRTIQATIESHFVMSVLTENYIRRRWPRLELAYAKAHNRPIASLSLLDRSTRRLPPELANAPMYAARLRGSDGRAIADLAPVFRPLASMVLAEVLRHTLHGSRVAIASQLHPPPARTQVEAVVLPRAVEQDTRKKKLMIYADPPLTAEELAPLSDEKTAFVTVAEYLMYGGRLPTAPHLDRPLAAAISAASVEGTPGIFGPQFEEHSIRIARVLVKLGATLTYGGDLRPGGLTELLVRVVSQYSEIESVAAMTSFVSWPLYTEWNDAERKRFETLCWFRPYIAPQLKGSIDPHKEKSVKALLDDLETQRLIARNLSSMRREIRADIHVVLGGKVRGALGRMPGILEEVVLALRRTPRPAVYVLGGFGGAAEVVYGLLCGDDRPEFTLAYQQDAFGPEDARRQQWDEYANFNEAVDWDDMRSFLRSVGLDGRRGQASPGLNNGLTEEENRRLGETTQADEIASLLGKGLTMITAGRS